MEKFDPVEFLRLAAQHRATNAMLVPVQYRWIMAEPDFDRYDLSSFLMKASTSAPFEVALKADVLKRRPGGLTEAYGLTEGGGYAFLRRIYTRISCTPSASRCWTRYTAHR